MKKIILLLIPFFIFSTSCNDDDNVLSPTIEQLESNFISAKIDGQDFKSDLVYSQISDIQVTQLFSISGAKEITTEHFENIIIVFTLPLDEVLESKSYQNIGYDCGGVEDICAVLSYGTSNVSSSNDLEFSSGYLSGEVEVNFTSIDYQSGGHAIGTFSGDMYNDNGEKISITDGKFNTSIE